MKQLIYFLIINILLNFIIISPSSAITTSDSTNIQQCTVELLNSKTTNLFEILYNKQNSKLILILNKLKLTKSQMNYEMNILCAYNVDIIRLNIKVDVFGDDDYKFSFDDKLIDGNIIRVDRNIGNSQVIYSIDYKVKNDENHQQDLNNAMTTTSQSLTFIEKYLLKQDKLNNTIWIYEELAVNTIIGYLQINVNLSTIVSTIKTNLNNHVESTVGSQMTFQLVKIFNDEKNNLYALTILKRIDRELIDYYDLSIDLKSMSQLIETIQLRVCLIDINDNIPMFKSNFNGQNVTAFNFNVTENHVYYNFGQVYANDKDLGLNSEIEYDILAIEKHFLDTSPNQLQKIDEAIFRINANSGYLSLMKKLDREDGDFYRISIRASDKGKPIKQRSIAYVDIEVSDENDNSPKFYHNRTYKFKIKENLPARTLIGNCKAHDSDKNARVLYYFEPKIYETLFGVDHQTGDFYTKQSFDADIGDSLRDNETNVYKFKIFAKDADHEDFKTDHINVDVKIDDVNDNEPFLKQKIETNLMLNLNSFNSNKTIVKLVAIDNDFTKLPVNFEILFIRKMSVNFLNDILKQQERNNETELISNFISNLKNRHLLTERVEKIQQNLSSLFSFNKIENKIEFESENYLDYFSDGLYNISIRFKDGKIQPDDVQYNKQISIRVLLFNNSNEMLTNSQFELLLNSIETWHDSYFKDNWISEYESNFLKSSGLLNEFYTKDNTEYVLENNAFAVNSSDCLLNNLIYYRFDFNIFKSGSKSAIQDFYRFNGNISRQSMFNSNLIIGLISMFVLIAIVLIAIVSYKHYKSIHCQDMDNQESKKFHNDSVDNTSSSNSSDRSFIPTITNSSLSTTNIKKSCLKSFDTKSSSSLSTSSNNLLYPSSTTAIATLINNNADTSSSIENEQLKCENLDETNKLNKKILPKTQFAHNYSKSAIKSTPFMPISKIDEEIHLFEIKQQKSETTTTTTTTTAASSVGEILKQKNDDDNGYYGSSDYSDNNSIKKSLKSNTDKLYSISSPTSSTVSTSTETTHASTTPSSCSTASSSPSLKPQQQQQIIPNTTADVKIYFERFERIYNSVSQDDDKANRRNSFTTCSYV